MGVRVTDSNGLVWNATIDDRELDRVAKRIESRVGVMSSNVQQEGDKMGGMFQKLAVGAAAFFTAQQGMQLVNGLIKVRGEFQQLEIAFGTMLGSKEKADKLMAEMVTLAAKTPFGLQDVAGGAKQLLAYGFAADDVTKNITMLGNVASGVGSQVGDLIYLYDTLKASGRVTQMDINQFAGRGIPIYAELAKVLNTNVEAVRNLVGEGKVGFPEIEKAFQNMTGQGGMFFNLMEAQSKSLTGQISNLQDAIAQMFNEIGQSQEGLFADSISGVTYLVENYKEVGKVLGVLIATYGAYRVALALAATANGGYTASQILTYRWLLIVERAQKLFNATILANPYVFAAATLVGLVVAIRSFATNASAAEQAQNRLNKINEDATKITDELKNSTQELTAIINSDTSTKAQQEAAFKRLQSLYGDRLKYLTLDQFQMQSNAQQQKELNAIIEGISFESKRAELEKLNAEIKSLQAVTNPDNADAIRKFFNPNYDKLEAALDVAEKLKNEILAQEEAARLAAMTETQKTEYYKQQLNEVSKQVSEWEKYNGKLQRSEDGVINIGDNLRALSILHLINQFNDFQGQVNSINKVLNPNAPRNKAYYEAVDKKLTEDFENIPTNSIGFKAAQNQYRKDKAANKKNLEQYSDTDKEAKGAGASAKRAATAAKKSTEERKRFLEQLSEAESQATINQKTEAEKQIAVVEDKYNKMREAAKKAGFDPKNPANAGTYQRIDNLEQKETGSTLYKDNSDAILKNLTKQREAWQQFEQYKTVFGEEEAKKRFGIEKDYLQQLTDMRDATKSDVRTAENEERLVALNNLIAEETKRRNDAENTILADLLTKYATYEQQKTALQEQYEKERAKLSPEMQAERDRQYNEDLKGLQNANSQKLVALSGYVQDALYFTKQSAKHQLEIFNKALAQKDLPPDVRRALQQKADKIQEIISKPNRTFAADQIDEEIGKTQKALDAVVASGDTTSETFRQLNDELMRLKQQKADIEITKLSSALNRISQLAPALQDLSNALNESGDSGAWGEVAAGIATVAAGASQLNDTFKSLKKNGATTGDAIVAGLQFALNLISTIVSASKRRKAAEEEFYANALGLQSQYNLGLIESHRLSAELSENVFLTDYFGRAKKGMEASIMAMASYQAAMDKLSEGKSKVRQKNVVDGKTVGQLALSGAAAGAIVGSVLPGVGNAVGAVIGGIVGAIGGLFAKKKKDVFGGLLEQYPELIKWENGVRGINVELAKSLIANNQLDAKTKELVQGVLNSKDAYEAAHKQMADVVKDLAGNMGNELRTALVDAWKAGEDSAKAFGKVVNNTLENILTNLLFHTAFNKLITKLQDDLADGFVNKSIGDITDAMGDFANKAKERIPLWEAAMGAMDGMMKKVGLEGISRGQKAVSNNSYSGAIQQITQQQADVLTGQFYAQTTVLNDINNKIPANYFGDSLGIMDRQFEMLAKIEGNTKDTAGNTKEMIPVLKSIDSKMNNAANQAAAAGYKI